MDKNKGKKETKKQKDEVLEVVEEKKEEKPFTFWDIQLGTFYSMFL